MIEYGELLCQTCRCKLLYNCYDGLAIMEMAMRRMIDSQRIRERRTKLGLTLDELARKSGINRKTIHLFEKGFEKDKHPKRGPRMGTLKKLADALEIDAEDLLVGHRKTRRDGDASEDGRHVQMNVRVARHARNAWSSLALRYGVGITHLGEMAPLAFLLIAEGSLHHRRQRLERLEAEKRRMEELSGSFPDWPRGVLSPARRLESASSDEQASIEARDLFGRRVLDNEDLADFPMPEGWDHEESNPFAIYVREQLRALDAEAELYRLGDRLSPLYRICEEDIRSLVGSDKDAMDAIHEGWVLLHEMPRELLRDGPAEQRAAWVKERLAAWREENSIRLDRELDLGEETK